MLRDAVTDEEEPMNDEITPQNKRIKGWSRLHITIEPIKLCVGFTLAFTNGVTIDMLQRNICYSYYNLTLEQCLHNISSGSKATIEGMTAEVNMLNQVAQGFFPLILILFIGPWSDINGRKPFIIGPLLGYLVYYLCWSIISFFPNMPVLYMAIPSIPLGLSGSIIAIYVCTWSYTCDNFDAESRPMRFSISVSSFITGNLLGNALAGQVVNFGGDYGYQIVFSTSFLIIGLTLLYTLFFLEETIVRPQGIVRSKLFDLKNVKNMFMVMLIRPEKGRLLSALVMTVLLSEIPLNAGDRAILYLVGKNQYSWTLNDYNLIAAISSIISAVSPVFLTWFFMKKFGMANNTVLIMAASVCVITEAMTALSTSQVMFWLSRIAVKLGSIIGPSIDTELSHIVSESNLGKAFTMTSICDALSPLIAIPLYTYAYKLLLPNHTLYIFFISAFLAATALIASVAIYFKKTSVAYMRQYDT